MAATDALDKLCTQCGERQRIKKRTVCSRCRYRARYDRNPEYFRERARSNREKFSDRHKAYQKRYRRENQARIADNFRRWKSENAHSQRLYHRSYYYVRRNRLIMAGGTRDERRLRDRWLYYGGLCYLCRAGADQWDHVIPVARGGSDWPSNLRPVCGGCNRRKGAKSLTEYLGSFDGGS